MSALVDLAVSNTGERPSPMFITLLLFHVGAGLVCVISGATAALSKKRRGLHPNAGRAYFWATMVVFVTSTGMSVLRWSQNAHLFVLGTVAFIAALTGYLARKVRWPGWLPYHIGGMGTSYIVLLTAFYVDNGPKLPVWKLLPPVAFWILPAAAGLPIVILALKRYAHSPLARPR